ncbi:cyclopropane-fatty-acyl-phospholipid synthase family protein [Streptomyces sp. NBC_01537]|uniref:class I SAM-dependent methyltransferase n=1 Tax=Streptomyces sp. NBC_01537 TaxID=2903896 RepID=UPI00386DA7BC
MPEAAVVMARCAQQLLGAPLPLRIRAWDGSVAGPADGPELVLRDRTALRHLLWQPDDLGLARGWVTGDLEVEGDLYDVLDRLSQVLWDRDSRQSPDEGKEDELQRGARTAGRVVAAMSALREVLPLVGNPLPPPRPAEEVPPRRGPAHTLRRDRAAISHHYDAGNDFYALMLGPSLVYSCAYWETGPDAPGATLEQAQAAKLDLVCRKLALEKGGRLLDVGCGWGSMALHAAQHHGVDVVGVTISTEQAQLARERVARAGLSDRIEIRVQDYREVTDGPYDAVSSIGMAEHVGTAGYRRYARQLHDLLRPGGRLLNHQIARRPIPGEKDYRLNGFIDRYVFPDGELTPVGATVGLLEEAGFEVRDVQALREHYAVTLRSWVTRLEENWDEAVRLVGPARARIWRLYMAASAVGFERNTMGVNQVLAVRAADDGASGMRWARDGDLW